VQHQTQIGHQPFQTPILVPQLRQLT
jgi:hypothetical protein